MSSRRSGVRRAIRVAAWAASLAIVVIAGLYAGGWIGPKEPLSRFQEIPRRSRAVPSPPEKLTPELRQLLDEAAERKDQTPLTVLVEMAEQVNLRDLFAWMNDHHVLTRHARRRCAVRALGMVAAQRKEPEGIEPFLADLQAKGLVVRFDGFSVVNRLAVTLAPAAIDLVAARPDVARIVEERGTVKVIVHEEQAPLERRPGPLEGIARNTVVARSWAIDALEAPAAWAKGYDGRGVVVGIIDTGVRGDHEQLAAGFRGGEDSWYDPRGADSPVDMGSHGTQVLSCAVGRNVAGRVIGVAPGATWVAASALQEGRGNNVFLTSAADWMLNHAQPDVLICSFGFGTDTFDEYFVDVLDAWRAAEINVVFSAGNSGPGYATNSPPANIPYVYPAGLPPISVGGVTKDMTLYRFSSEGPNANDVSPFPALVAPAEDLTVAYPLTKDAIIRAEGTSLAAGYVAGVEALMLQANPDLFVNEMDAILRKVATDLGPAGIDNKYGRGMVKAVAAIEGALEQGAAGHRKPPPPTIR